MIIAIIIVFTLYIIFIIWCLIGWKGLRRTARVRQEKRDHFYSIIIPARNEERHIGICLESILRQKTDSAFFEVIVVNDFSEDDTYALAAAFFEQHPIGRVINLSDHLPEEERINSFKKKAIEIAIAQSKGDWIIQTDADCVLPIHWLSEIMQSSLEKQVHIIAGPVSLLPSGRSFSKKILYWLQSLDFLTMQAVTAATHYWNTGSMCNGANLAYRKRTFHEVNGFRDIDDLASGDDMMLMQKITGLYPTGSRYLKSEKAIVATASQPGWRDFLNQRIRWSSKAGKYQDKKLSLMLLLVYLFNLSFLFIFSIGLFDTFYLLLGCYLLAAKTGVELFLVIPSAAFFNKKKQVFVFPFLQPLHILYIIIAGLLGWVGSYQWKGRKVK